MLQVQHRVECQEVLELSVIPQPLRRKGVALGIMDEVRESLERREMNMGYGGGREGGRGGRENRGREGGRERGRERGREGGRDGER